MGKHLENEALAVRTDFPAPRTKLLCDVDDTLECSQGSYAAGSDTSYPKHVTYPGVHAVLRCLDRTYDPDSVNVNLVFLTARPHVYKDMIEELTYEKYRLLVDTGLMHS